MRYIISIDPGLLNIGFAVFSYNKKIAILEHYGLITTSPDDKIEKRLFEIQNDLKKILDQYIEIKICSIEKIFFVKNVTNGINVSMSKGVVLSTLYNYGINIVEYSPMKIKKTISGYGMADKISMRKMIWQMFPSVKTCKQDDTLDAIAIGATYFLENRVKIK